MAATLSAKAQKELEELFKCEEGGCENDKIVCATCHYMSVKCWGHSTGFIREGVYHLHGTPRCRVPPKCIGCYKNRPTPWAECRDGCGTRFDETRCSVCNPNQSANDYSRCKPCYERHQEEHTCKVCEAKFVNPYECLLCKEPGCIECRPPRYMFVEMPQFKKHDPFPNEWWDGKTTKRRNVPLCRDCCPENMGDEEASAAVREMFTREREQQMLEWAQEVLNSAEVKMTKSASKTD